MGWNQREVGSLGGIPTGLPLACQGPWPVGTHSHTHDMELSSLIAVVIAVVSLGLNLVALRISMLQVTAATNQTDVQRKIHEDASQPYVWADIRPNPAQGVSLDFVLGNSGPTIATDVTVTISPPFEALRELSSTALDRLAKGVSSLPPGRTITWSLGKSAELVAPTEPQPRTITINANGPFGPLPQLDYVIDMTDLRESNDRPDGSLYQLAKAVDRRPSAKDLARVARELRRLGTDGIDTGTTE